MVRKLVIVVAVLFMVSTFALKVNVGVGLSEDRPSEKFIVKGVGGTVSTAIL